jgi:hypothetical protein
MWKRKALLFLCWLLWFFHVYSDVWCFASECVLFEFRLPCLFWLHHHLGHPSFLFKVKNVLISLHNAVDVCTSVVHSMTQEHKKVSFLESPLSPEILLMTLWENESFYKWFQFRSFEFLLRNCVLFLTFIPSLMNLVCLEEHIFLMQKKRVFASQHLRKETDCSLFSSLIVCLWRWMPFHLLHPPSWSLFKRHCSSSSKVLRCSASLLIIVSLSLSSMFFIRKHKRMDEYTYKVFCFFTPDERQSFISLFLLQQTF